MSGPPAGAGAGAGTRTRTGTGAGTRTGTGAGAGSEMPDLSHLTEEERSIILSVMERQRKEEEKEQSTLRWSPLSGLAQLLSGVAADVSELLHVRSPTEEEAQTKLHQQFKLYKDQVKKLGEESQAAHLSRPESATCGVCRKTKFADGCGHACCYCQSRFCARCGGRVSLRANKVMWVCNGCRKQQDILTQSGDLDSTHHRSPGVPLPPTHTLLGGPAPLSNGALERPPGPSVSLYDGAEDRMPRSPSDHCAGLPHGYHGNRGEEFLGRRQPVRDGRGRWLSQDLDQDLDLHQRECRRRQEEEFQARYRSDPNLARYPVKPQPCEEAMRMLAQVGRVRHQRRHSDVSLANAAPQHLTPPRTALRQGYPRGGPRSLSVERAASHSGAASPRHSPQHLEPSPAPRRKPAYESAAQRGRAVTAMHVIGSFSSSEDELEYASCDEHHRDMDSQWWDQGPWHGEGAPASTPVAWQPSKDVWDLDQKIRQTI